MILASERFGASPERLAAIHDFENSKHFTEAEKAAFRYGKAAAQVPNAVTPQMGADLRKYYIDADIVEITAVIALFGYLNRWNDSMGTTLEDKPVAAGKKHLQATGWDVGKHTGGVDAVIGSADVVFFNLPGCPFCQAAESALQQAGIEFTKVDISEHLPALKAKTGKSSAPSVWIKGTYVGGCNDGTEPWHGVKPMLASGKFKQMLGK